MNRYIDAEKLKYEIERCKLSNRYIDTEGYEAELLEIIDSLQQEQTDMGEVSDGYHTFNELYYYRMLYNAAFFNLLPKEWVHKSKRHHTGEECFGGGWFIVMANLPTGQVSNHYELKDWGLFKVPEKEFADEWDGHTPQEAAERIHRYLTIEQPETDLEVSKFCQPIPKNIANCVAEHYWEMLDDEEKEDTRTIETTQHEQPEVNLEKEYSEFVEQDAVYSRLVNSIVGKAIARHFYDLGLNARKEE